MIVLMTAKQTTNKQISKEPMDISNMKWWVYLIYYLENGETSMTKPWKNYNHVIWSNFMSMITVKATTSPYPTIYNKKD